jgi:hypothetical protein
VGCAENRDRYQPFLLANLASTVVLTPMLVSHARAHGIRRAVL